MPADPDAESLAVLLSAFRASPLDRILEELVSSLRKQQQISDELREAQKAQALAHASELQAAQQTLRSQELALKELQDTQRAHDEALAKSVQDAAAARSEQAEASKRTIELQRELIEHQADDIAALRSRIDQLEAKLTHERAETQKKQNEAAISNKAQEDRAAELAHEGIKRAKETHRALTVTIQSINEKLNAKQATLNATSGEIKFSDEDKGQKDSGENFLPSDHLSDLLDLSASVYNGLAPLLTQYGIHIEFAKRKLSYLQCLQMQAPGNPVETTLVEGLNQALANVLTERTTVLEEIEQTSKVLNQTFVTFQDILMSSTHNETVNYFKSTLAPKMQDELLERMEGLIASQSKSIIEAAVAASSPTKSEVESRTKSKSKLRSRSKRRRKQRKAEYDETKGSTSVITVSDDKSTSNSSRGNTKLCSADPKITNIDEASGINGQDEDEHDLFDKQTKRSNTLADPHKEITETEDDFYGNR